MAAVPPTSESCKMWLLLDEDENPQGPVSREKLMQMYNSGNLAADTRLKREGDKCFLPFLKLAILCKKNPLEAKDLGNAATTALNSEPSGEQENENVYWKALRALSKIQKLSSGPIPSTFESNRQNPPDETPINEASLDSSPELRVRPPNNRDMLRRFVCHSIHPGSQRICGKSFSARKNLKRHQETLEKINEFSCEVCGQKFWRRDELKYHTKTVHHPARVSCKYCKRGQINAKALQSHIINCPKRKWKNKYKQKK